MPIRSTGTAWPLEGLLGVGRPKVGRGDDDAARPLLLARQRHEGVDLLLREGCSRRVALALDGDEAAFGVASHEVDADVNAAPARPVHPSPHLSELLLEGAIGLECVEHQPLEAVALVVLVRGNRSDVGQHLLDGRHRSPPHDSAMGRVSHRAQWHHRLIDASLSASRCSRGLRVLDIGVKSHDGPVVGRRDRFDSLD